jgi:hypothetical protein
MNYGIDPNKPRTGLDKALGELDALQNKMKNISIIERIGSVTSAFLAKAGAILCLAGICMK